MPRSIHKSVPGGTYFFTVRTARRGDDLLLRKVEHLRHVTRQTQERYPFVIEEAVVLGDAVHMIWTLPDGDADFSVRWRMLKSLFSRGVEAPVRTETRRLRLGEKGTWQRRFWEHVIRDEEDFAAHRHMIYTAPVQAGLVKRPEEWPYSSVHRAIRNGTFAEYRKVRDGHVPGRIGCTTDALYAVRSDTAA